MARTVGLDRRRLLRQRHQAGRGLPRRPRPVVRVRAVGGAERLLTVDDRGRDRRPHRRRLIAELNGDAAGPGSTAATADHYQRIDQGLDGDHATARSAPTRTSSGCPRTAIPNAEFIYNLGNGGPDADQRAIIDAGFLELPRLGILPADDPDVANSLGVVDDVIAATTTSGDGFYRYGTSTPAPRTATATATPATRPTARSRASRGPVPARGQAQNQGSGHLWPVLSAERGEHQVADRRSRRRRRSCCSGWPTPAPASG